MKGKKVTVISISAVILALAIIYLIFFSTLGLHIYNGKDEIISTAQSFSRTAIVTKSGDVYINGFLDDAAGGSLGIAKPKRYRNLYNSGRELKFVSLYSGHNAASVWLSRDGGAVITNGKEAYVFSSKSKSYSTPAKFADNILCARPSGERVYLLTADGRFGFSSLDDSSAFTELMKSVKSFELAPEGDEILIVATDGRLCVADSSGSVTESTQNVAEVSIAQSSHDGMSETVISIVRTDGVLLRYTAKSSFKTADVLSSTPDELAHGIKSAVSYCSGTVAIDAQGNALAYGKDFGFGNSELNGTVICADCKKLSSTDQSVIIIKADAHSHNTDISWTAHTEHLQNNQQSKKQPRSRKSASGFYLLYSIMSSIPHPSAVHILSSTSLSYRLTRFL